VEFEDMDGLVILARSDSLVRMVAEKQQDTPLLSGNLTLDRKDRSAGVLELDLSSANPRGPMLAP
jgi:hypothetical protein